MSGMILATVTMALSVAACLTPRRTSRCTPHSSTDAATIAVTVVPSPNTGKEDAQRRLDEDEAGDVGQAAGDPVAQRRHEAQVVAEARLRVGVDARLQVRLAQRQRLEHEREHQHAGAGDAPGDERAEHARRAAERGRQREDARADHRPDDQRDQRAARQLRFARVAHHRGPGAGSGINGCQGRASSQPKAAAMPSRATIADGQRRMK